MQVLAPNDSSGVQHICTQCKCVYLAAKITPFQNLLTQENHLKLAGMVYLTRTKKYKYQAQQNSRHRKHDHHRHLVTKYGSWIPPARPDSINQD